MRLSRGLLSIRKRLADLVLCFLSDNFFLYANFTCHVFTSVLRLQAFISILHRMSQPIKTTVFKSIRQNHAIEHATITLLLAKGAPTPLYGNATPWGFNVYGRISTEDLLATAEEALLLLKNGEHDMAISPYCGTNLIVGGISAALVAAITMSGRKITMRRFIGSGAVSIAAAVASRGLGRFVQRRFTTLSDVGEVEITSIQRLTPGEWRVHHLRTNRK